MKTEKKLQSYIKKRCVKGKINFYKMHCESQSGFPDLLLTYKGRTVFLEIKSPAGTGRLSALQILTINELKKQGQEIYVIDSKTQADLIVNYIVDGGAAKSNRQSVHF